MYKLYFEDFDNVSGDAIYEVRDENNLDPIGELISLQDDFLNDKDYDIVSYPPIDID